MSSLVTENRPETRKRHAVSVKILSLSLAIALSVLTFTGCADELQQVSGSGINAPVVMQYTVSNPLEYKDVKEGDGNAFDYHYIEISGLADSEVEKAINQRIKAVYDDLKVKDVPPYRGIKLRIPEGCIISNESIYVDIAGNFNNILSIVFHKNTAYQDPDYMKYTKDPFYYDSSKYFSEIECLNIDLNTGDEIKLKDLFCDNVDYMDLVNSSMSRFLASNYADDEGYYIGMYGNVKLVESFKGLNEDQIFAVYPHGIAFIFDYRTPQFETGGMAVSAVLNYQEFGDNLAMTERYYDSEVDLYTSAESPVKAFVMSMAENDIAGNEQTQEGSVSIYQSWSYSSQLPEKIKDRLEEMRAVDLAKAEELKEICSSLPAGTADNPGNRGAYEIMVYGEKIGPYYNVRKYESIYLPDSSTMLAEYYCFDGETLEELKLEDVFRKDVDYKMILDGAIRKAAKESGYSEPPDTIEGFNLQADALLIAAPDPASPNGSGGMNLYIPYKDIGCDNLNIFDE